MKRAIVAVLTTCVLGFALAACGGSGSGGEASSGEDLTLGAFLDFSSAGGLAAAPTTGCITGQESINAAGGVLGHKVKCTKFDAGADPADAVPAAAKMLSTASNLVLTVGPDAVAAATEPIIAKEKIVMFSNTGDAHFNSNTDPYFYRQVPGDDVSAEALALWTAKSGRQNVAMVFENGGGAKPVTQPLAETLEQLGVNITENLTIAPDQTSYRTEVQSVLGSEPELIITETDPQTATTFFSELLELNNGELIPILGTSATTDPEYPETLGKAIGEKELEENFEAVTISAPKPGPALTEFQKYLKAASSTVPEAESFATEPYTTRGYDSIIVAALAMNAAGSTSPEKFQPYITKVVGEPKGRTEVHTYAEGVAALKKHEKIVYVGTSGPILWNSHHNLEGAFQVLGFDPASHSYPPLATISAAELAKVKSE